MKNNKKQGKSIFWYLERIACLLLCIFIVALAIFILWASICFILIWF